MDENVNPEMSYTRNMLYAHTKKEQIGPTHAPHIHEKKLRSTHHSFQAVYIWLLQTCDYQTCMRKSQLCRWFSMVFQLIRYIFHPDTRREWNNKASSRFHREVAFLHIGLARRQSINQFVVNQPKVRSHVASTQVLTFARPSGSNWPCCAGCSNPPCCLQDQSPYTPHTVTAMTGMRSSCIPSAAIFTSAIAATTQLCLIFCTHLLKVRRLRAQCDVVPCTIRDASIMLALCGATGEGARLVIKGLGAIWTR